MGRKDREIVRDLLERRDLDGLISWARGNRGATRSVLSFIYGTDELLRWRALEAIGKVSAQRAKDGDLRGVKSLVRQLFWTMNDESGGTGWHSPEAIGEILYNVPELLDEFGKLLAPLFREEPFERGAYFAVARVTGIKPELFEEFIGELAEAAGNADPYIRGWAAAALAALDAASALDGERIDALAGDETRLTVYDFEAGGLEETRIADIAGDLK